ncbi:MAG: protein kinase [Thermoanaerobaculaceae bacterium]
MTLPAAVGRYTVLGELGRGAMGVVFRALDPALDRQVAVKVIASRGGETAAAKAELEARFLREARVAARISHPNVVTVFDAGREGDSLYLVMELVSGESLGGRLVRSEFPSAPEALEMAARVADALAAAHALGVVHRDIKPGNVMVTRSGGIKVADFGVAKAVGEETNLTRTGTVVGSPTYMAPEQVRGETLDGRSDLFSLGVVLYELLMHRRPFPAETVTTLIYQILHEDPLADPAVSTALGENVAAFLRWCLEKTPEKRIPDAASFAAGARTVAASLGSGDPVTTAPTAAISAGPMRTWRPARVVVPVTLAVLGALAALGIMAARHGVRRPVPAPVAVPSPSPLTAATPVHRAAGPRAAASRPAPSSRPTRPPDSTAAVVAMVPEPPAASVPTAPRVVEIFYCQRAAEFKVAPEDTLVTVDGVPIGRADNSDHARADKKYLFSQPGRHYVKLTAPGYRTTWIAVVVDPKVTEETAEIETRLLQ